MRTPVRLCATLLVAVAVVAAAMSRGLADPAFDQWVRDFWPAAKSAGVSRNVYDLAFRGITPDPEVLEKARAQPEFATPLWDYVEGRVSENRIDGGREMLARYASLLESIEKRYRVDRHTVVAIWGMESSYGEVLSNPKIVKSVIRSLATLAYGDKRRARFARQQLVAALSIAQSGDISLERMTGSWAGAMGHTQFIPTTYEAYAVDFDGDGRRDFWTTPTDALASTANYLARAGWIAGTTWGYEVALPEDFDYRLAEAEQSRPLSEWRKLGVRRVRNEDFPRPGDKASLITPAGANGPAFLLLRNHFVIKRYNNATAYALAVGHLADRLRGGGPFARPWPADERPLTADEAIELQQHLSRAGYYAGTIDGKIGPASRAAIRAYQGGRGMAADGFAGLQLLRTLRSG